MPSSFPVCCATRMPIEHVIRLVYQLQLALQITSIPWKKGVVNSPERYLKDGSLMKLYDDSDSEILIPKARN